MIIEPPVVNEKPGGIWLGARPNGTEIVVLISKDGNIRILDMFGNQGFGTVVVTNQDQFSADYKLVPEYGQMLIDGSAFADCTYLGTVQQRVAITVVASCLTSLGNSFGGEIVLAYDQTYDMDSSIARISGTYQNADGDIMMIDVNGALFLQNAQYGCVVNGQVSLLDSDWNLYGVELTTEGCVGGAEPLNGASWTGLATIVVIDGIEFVAGGVTADVSGQMTSLIIAWQKL